MKKGVRTNQKAPNNSEKPKSTEKCQTTQKKKCRGAMARVCCYPQALLGLALGHANGEEKREKRELGGAREARGRAAAPGRPCPVPAPVALARAGRLALPREATVHPDLHVSEVHSHARQCLPACRPPAATPRRDRGSLQPAPQPRAGEPASERRAGPAT